MKNIVVVGSLNMDLVMAVDRMPKEGETIKGNSTNYFIGGKGSNQAVAATRLGNKVSMVGAVGNDTFGEKIKKHLHEEGVNVSTIKTDKETFTGLASIFKTKSDNSIVVIPGANDFCDKRLVDENEELIKNADILITQFEVPVETVRYALEMAKKYNVTTILNPAPAIEVEKDILKNADIITPNETEFEIITGKVYKDSEEFEKTMIKWQEENNTRLIVTRGKLGASFVEDNKVKTIKSIEVDVVDTTGAGDTFNGALGHALANGYDFEYSVKFAGIAASLSVTKFGAQTGMPSLDLVNKYLK